MGLPTNNINKNKVNRKQQVAELRKKHEPLFKLEGYENPLDAKFIPKMAYMPQAGAELVVAFFPSELEGGQDIYTEFVSKQNEPEDNLRRLWKWPFNPEYQIEYKTSEPHPQTGDCRYYIPCNELINVDELYTKEDVGATIELDEELQFELPDPDKDAPINQMTIRDKAAIDWKLPVSGRKWLNDLIRETFKDGGN